MARMRVNTFLRQLTRGMAAERLAEQSDRQLVERLHAGPDEAAFEVLIRRHGPMVYRVCWRVLQQAEDTEDAFQATFLLLARKLGAVKKRDSLASWLHGVARRVALDARKQTARRRRHEERAVPYQPGPPDETTWGELRTALEMELASLPEKLRLPLILCYLEGRTQEEAAGQLGWSKSTLVRRLVQARAALGRRLSRRGVVWPAAFSALMLSDCTAPAALSSKLIGSTVEVAACALAGRAAVGIVSSKVASLAGGVMNAMFMSKWKLVVLALVLLGGLATGAAGLFTEALCGRPALPKVAAAQPPQGKAKSESVKVTPGVPPGAKVAPAAGPSQPAAAQTTISGRVLGPDGKPVPGARVYRLKWNLSGRPPQDKTSPKVWAETDKDGRFSFKAPRYGGEWFVTAAGSGFGPGWDVIGRRVIPAVVGGKPQEAPADGDLVVRLARDDVPVRGRLLDLQGEPVAGAVVRVFALKASADGSLDKFIEAVKKRPVGKLYNDQEHLSMYNVDGLAHFFPPITTDKDGRFQIKGIGRDRVVDLTLKAPTIETTVIHVVTRPGLGVADIRIPKAIISYADGRQKDERLRLYYPPTFTHAAVPCRVVTGVVRDKATGKPIAGAVVRGEPPIRYPVYYNQTTTDREGRYRLTGLRLTPTPGEPNNSVAVLPPDGEPYPTLTRALPADKEAKEAKIDFDLARGVWLEGQVKDKATGKGVEARLQHFVFTDWKFEGRVILPAGGPGARVFRDPFQQDTTDKEGKFRLLVAADRAVLAATAIGEGMNHYRRGVGADKIKGEAAKDQGEDGGGIRLPPPGGMSADAFDALVEVKPEKGATSVRCDVVLDPGRALTVQVRGPDGKPLDGLRVNGQFAPSPYNGWSQAPLASEFTVYGLEPGKKRTLLVEHAKNNLAARREIKADERGPVVVTLQPASAAVGRLVGDDGRPLANAEIALLPSHSHSRRFKTDAQGKFRIEGLIPGVSYQGYYLPRPGYAQQMFDDLSLKSGEVKDLGDVKIKKGDSQ